MDKTDGSMEEKKNIPVKIRDGLVIMISDESQRKAVLKKYEKYVDEDYSKEDDKDEDD